MSTTRRAAQKNPDAAPPTAATTYEISIGIADTDLNDQPMTLWRAVAEQTGASAHTAIRAWAEKQGEQFAGGPIRAIPTSRITTVDVKVETKRQLTLGTPAS